MPFLFISVLMWLMLFYVQVNPQCLFFCFIFVNTVVLTQHPTVHAGLEKETVSAGWGSPWASFFFKDRLDSFYFQFSLSCVAHPQWPDARRWRLQSQSIFKGVSLVSGSAAVKGTVLTRCGLRGVSSGIFQWVNAHKRPFMLCLRLFCDQALQVNLFKIKSWDSLPSGGDKLCCI